MSVGLKEDFEKGTSFLCSECLLPWKPLSWSDSHISEFCVKFPTAEGVEDTGIEAEEEGVLF